MFDISEDGIFEDYEEMLMTVDPDIVSVAVPPAIHANIVIGCARSGTVEAIHCEKPMAKTLAGARRMVEVCNKNDVNLTFNRQRRFSRPFTETKRLINDGEIGDLQRIEISWGDFFDIGAHAVDLAGMFTGDRPAEWVIAQLDYREKDVRFGVHQENQIWAHWRYDNGVNGLMTTGEGASLVDAAILLRGTEGTIRIDGTDGPVLELERDGVRTEVDVNGETMHGTPEDGGRLGSQFHDRAINNVVDALRTGRESRLSGRTGLQTANILFGGYESVRRRSRVDLPIDLNDNPLETMIEDGALSPTPIDPDE